MTLLVGLHGAGKTYLLNVINECLPNWLVGSMIPPAGHDFREEFVGSFSLRVLGLDEDVDVKLPIPRIEYKPEYPAGVSELESTLISGFSAVSELAFVAQGYRSHKEEAASFVDLDPASVAAMGLILGHRYSGVRIAEYEYEHTLFPLVQGFRNGVPFTSWTLSGGEFWVVYLLWILRGAGEREVVLIDEPESYLAAPAHVPLLQEIARLAEKHRFQVVIATHSSTIIEAVPPEMMRLVSSSSGGIRAEPVLSGGAVLRALGRPPMPVTAIVYVEDVLAGRLVRQMLEEFGGRDRAQFDVIASGGASEVRSATRVTSRSARLAAIAVLDGDERTAVAAEGTLFLPGRRPPEEEILDAVESDADRYGKIVGVIPAEVRTAVQAARSVDHQRAFARLATVLGLDEDRVLREAVTSWLSVSGVRVEAQELVAALLSRTPSKS